MSNFERLSPQRPPTRKFYSIENRAEFNADADRSLDNVILLVKNSPIDDAFALAASIEDICRTLPTETLQALCVAVIRLARKEK